MSKTVRVGVPVIVAFSLCVLAASPSARADEATPATPFGQMASRLNPANWKMPTFSTLLPQQEEKARITKKKDSLFSEVGKTASNSWSRTKAALNPTNFFTTSARTPTRQPSTTKKPGFFSSLFAPAASERDSATANDFLKLPRPTP